MPNMAAINRLAFIKEAMQSLSTTIKRNEGFENLRPTTGYAQADALFGLADDNGQKAVPIIQGPTGTGKTTTLVEVAKQYIAWPKRTAANNAFEFIDQGLDEDQRSAVKTVMESIPSALKGKPLRVLVLSQANPAVNVIGERFLREGIPFVRVGNEEGNISAGIKRGHYLDVPALTPLQKPWSERDQAIELMREKYKQGETMIILGTINGYHNDMFLRQYLRLDPIFAQFDFVLVDEAGKATEDEGLWAARAAKEGLVLFGDHAQLQPTVITMDTQEIIMDELGGEPAWEARLKAVL